MSGTPAPSAGPAFGRKPPSRDGAPSLSSSVRRGALWSMLSTLLLRLSNVAVTAVVAHILAPHDFGVFTVALTAYTIIFSLSEFGVASCLVRADLDIDAMAPTMITVSLLTSALSAEVMAVYARPIATALGSADGAEPIRIMALAVLINGFFAVPGAQLTRDFRQDKLFLANIVSLVPSTAALLILAKSGSGATAFAWSRVIAQVVMGGVMAASAPRFYLPGLSRRALSVLFRFGLPLAGANIVNFILINVDYAFVGHLMGATALGAYVLAFTIASSPGLLLGNVINSIAMPAFSRVKHDPGRLRDAMVSSLRAVSLVLMPMCAMLIALARPLVLTLYGAKWGASVEVLAILSFYGGISIICILFANILTSLGMAKFTLVVQLLWLGALVPAMALGVRRDGIVGAAVAHIVIIGPLVLPSYLWVLRRATAVRLARLGKAVAIPLLAAAAAGFAARAVATRLASPLAQLAAGLAVGLTVYALAVAPQATALLSERQLARLRALPPFRWAALAWLIRRPAAGDPGPAGGNGAVAAGDAVAARDVVGDRIPVAPPAASRPAATGVPGGVPGRDATVTRATGLLRPEARVVPFWPSPEIEELLRWCRAPGQAAVRLVTGEGGAGKTRLAIELSRVLERDGWQSLWVPPESDPGAVRAAVPAGRPALLLVDHAERRVGLAGFLAEVTGGPAGRGPGDLDPGGPRPDEPGWSGPGPRVILLARNSGEWWHKLVGGSGRRLGETLQAAQPIRLWPVPPGPVRARVFDAAVTGFAARLGVRRPAAMLALSDPEPSVLIVHAAALTAVLRPAEAPADPPRSGTEVLESLLRHELRYAAQAAAARGLDLDPAAQRRAIAAACLAGPGREPAVAALLRRLPDLAGSAERRGQAAGWLRDLYPGPGTGPETAGRPGAMYPGRLAEHLVVSELTAQPGLIPALFRGLDGPSAREALTVLGRAALSDPAAAPLLAAVLAADLEQLAIPALWVAVETNPGLDRLIAEAIATQPIPVQALNRIAAALPGHSLALAATASAVLRRLARVSRDHAGSLEPSRRVAADP